MGQTAKCARSAVAVDDLERVATQRDKSAEGQCRQRDIVADGHGTGHIELIVVAVGRAGCGATNLDFKGSIVGEGEIAVNSENPRRLARSHRTIDRHRVATGHVDIRASTVVDFSVGDQVQWIVECCRVNVDIPGSGVADGDRAEAVGQSSEFGVVYIERARCAA